MFKTGNGRVGIRGKNKNAGNVATAELIRFPLSDTTILETSNFYSIILLT